VDRLADQIDSAAAALATVDRQLPSLAPGAAAFGADDTGRPGRIGRALYAGWTAVLAARSREAADASAALSEIARSVRASTQAYAETDEAVRHRFHRGF
jgi:excreted virulence factor EspC (type VII ESX diderm)